MVQLVVLDVNETLFSLQPVADRLATIGLDGQLELWFARILRDGFAATAAGRNVAFADLARHHLAALLDQHGIEVRDESLDHAIQGFSEVTAQPDVEEGLNAVRDAGLTAVTMTVGSAEITRQFLDREGLTELVAGVYDAQAAGQWKPAPDAYRYVFDDLGMAADQAALVAVHPWDVMGAQQAGLIGAWLDRSGGRYPSPYGTPTVTAPSLPALVEQLMGLRKA